MEHIHTVANGPRVQFIEYLAEDKSIEHEGVVLGRLADEAHIRGSTIQQVPIVERG